MYQSIHLRTAPTLVIFAYTIWQTHGYLLPNSVQQLLTPLAHVSLFSISASYAELCGNMPNHGTYKIIPNYYTIQILHLESYPQGTCYL